MYQFDARNADELSLKVGDIVHVSGHAIFHHFFLVWEKLCRKSTNDLQYFPRQKNKKVLPFQVKPDQTGVEPGWMCGSMDGAEGIFPEAYVEFQEEITAGSPEAQSVTSPAWVLKAWNLLRARTRCILKVWIFWSIIGISSKLRFRFVETKQHHQWMIVRH